MNPVLEALHAWYEKPYDPALANDLVDALPRKAQGKVILQRQSAFDPNLHLIVDDSFPTNIHESADGDLQYEWAIFCTRGHRFVGTTPEEAWSKAQQHDLTEG